MLIKKTTQRDNGRLSFSERAKKRARRIGRGRGLFAIAVLLGALGATNAVFADSPLQSTQMTIGKNTIEESITDDVSSVVFTGAYSLILEDGQTLRSIFVSKESGASLVLGDGMETGQAWTIVSNNPSWSGTTAVYSGNTLTVVNGTTNPLGAYSDTSLSSYGIVSLYDGARLVVSPRAADSTGSPAVGEITMGALMTDSLNDVQGQDNAVVDVGENQTLTVMDGMEVDDSVGLTKQGKGTLKLVVNGSKTTVVPTADNNYQTESSVITSYDLGRLYLNGGELTVVDGTMKVADADVTASSIHVGADSTLDIQKASKIEIAGTAGDVVFQADDGSNINLYVDADGSTSYVATTYNTYMKLGKTSLNIVGDKSNTKTPDSLTVFSTQDVGQTIYTASDITVTDNILGKNYVLDTTASTAEKVVLKLESAPTFKSAGKTTNERAVGGYIDRYIASGKYTEEQYEELYAAEQSLDSLNMSLMTGEVHASTVGFMLANNLTTTQTLFDMLRDNTLVAYSGQSSVEPMDYGGTNQPGVRGGASRGAFDNGRLYYNTDTNSYGPGVVPIYNGETYGSGTGGMSGGVYGNQSSSSDYISDPSLNGGSQNGAYDESYQGGDYNFGWQGPIQASELVTMRGQAATYGDPGTLIYSAWFAGIGGSPDSRIHKDAARYNGKQRGFLTGLDLFCSCDCRFGAYYGYQNNEMKSDKSIGTVKTSDHVLGLYHQFGDETVYNILNARGGYDHYKTSRSFSALGGTDTLTAKYSGWNLGASFERGANFAVKPFVFSPYASVDYNFLARNKFTEKSATNSGYALRAGKSNYHSLRGQIGGRIAVDMYPGDQQLRLTGRAAYIHEFLDAMYGKTTMSFADFSDTIGGYDVIGNSLGRDWCLVGVGLDWAPVPALMLFVKGDYLSNKYIRDPWGTAGLKFRW